MTHRLARDASCILKVERMLSAIEETPFEIAKIILRERILSSLKSRTLARRVRAKVTFDETQRTIISRRGRARDIDQM